MATEEKNPSAEGKEELPAEQEVSKPGQKQKKKSRKGIIFFFLCVVIAAGIFSMPSVQVKINEKIRELKDRRTAVVAVKVEPVVEKKIATRLEQLENARDFENAELVVASVEPVLEANNDQRNVLKDQYDLLTLEFQQLQTKVHSFENEQIKQIEDMRRSMPNPGLIEERLLSLASKEDVLSQQASNNGTEIKRLEKNKADVSSILSVMARLDTVEQQVKTSAVEKEKAAALLLALYQLREAAMAGQSFLTEQQAVLAMAVSAPRLAEKVQRLGLAADSGVWTKTALEESFNGYADKAVLSTQLSPKTDWFHKALNSLRKLVIIRRIDVSSEDMSADAVIARAQVSVKKGDVQTAVLQLKNLNGSAAEVMKDWVVAAERYILTRKTINESIAAVLGILYSDQLKGG